MKIAIVHDFAYKMGGAERLVDTLLSMYPHADLFMLFGDKSKLSKNFSKRDIKYSFLQKIPFIKYFYRWTFPIWPGAIESFNFEGYDLVISHSTVAAKGVITDINTYHFAYISSFMRYAWDLRHRYFDKKPRVLRFFINFWLSYLRAWDISVNNRVNSFVACSNFVARRMQKYYKIDNVPVIFPPVDIKSCLLHKSTKEQYFLSIAPFEPNKNGDLAIECAKKHGFNLKIIGTGSGLKKIRKSAKKYRNIEILGWVDEKQKLHLLAGAKGLLFCGIEDFGIAAVEAIGSGTPVIALKAGGALDYIVEGETGVFFENENADNLWAAITKSNQIKWNYEKMHKFAYDNFDKHIFVQKIASELKKKLK